MSRSVTTTNGTLTAKIQRQEAMSTIQPPASGPITAAIPPHAVHVPIAAPRSRSSSNVVVITASEAGVSSALAAPCTARAATSVSMLGASAHRRDATPNAATPSEKMRRSP